MKNKTYIWISVAILGVGGYFIYKNLLKKPVRTKQENIDIIVGANMTQNANNILSTFEEGYLNEWANAVKNSKSTFTYKLKKYNTKGGSSIK
jgi:hypothetical protein